VLPERLARLAPLILVPIACSRRHPPAPPAPDPAASLSPDEQQIARPDESDGGVSAPATQRNITERVCTASLNAGLNVTVVSASGKPVCNAHVRLTRDGEPEPLKKIGCVFVGAYEEPGTFAIAVSAGGFQPARVEHVVVRWGGGCHVLLRDVVVTLHPTM
jgi:hypothetical protein